MFFSKMCVVVGGTLSLFMVVFHSRFYKMFDWGKDFEKIRFRNQRILYTVHMALLLLFAIFSFLSFFYVDELSRASGLAQGLLVMYSLFWLWRTLWQVIYFRAPKGGGAGKMPPIHYVLIIIFALLFFVYLVPVVLRHAG